MYVEFKLPTGAAAAAAAHANHVINRALHEWSDRYNIPYSTKIIKYTKRITFNNDAHYAFFAMTWNPDNKVSILSRWRLINDPNNKTSW